MSIPDPGPRIPDPKTPTKEKGEKNCCPPFFCRHKYHKIENYIIFVLAKKIIWAYLHRIMELFTQKFVIKLSKYRFGIQDLEKFFPDLVSKRHRIPDPGQTGTGSTYRLILIIFICNCYKKKANLCTSTPNGHQSLSYSHHFCIFILVMGDGNPPAT